MDNDGCERLIQRQPGNVWKVALTAATAGSLNTPRAVMGATEPVGQGEGNETRKGQKRREVFIEER